MNVKVKGSLSFGAAIGLTMTCISIHPTAAAYHTLSSGEYHIHIENINVINYGGGGDDNYYVINNIIILTLFDLFFSQPIYHQQTQRQPVQLL